MMFEYTRSLIIIMLIIVSVALLGGLFWAYNNSRNSHDSSIRSPQLNSDLATIQEIMNNDSHLHRLLMIEIISDKTFPNNCEIRSLVELYSTDLGSRTPTNDRGPIVETQKEIMSEIVTFTKMSAGISSLGKSLVRSFGTAIAQRISTLMHKRNEIIRDYYLAMRNVVCNGNTCIHISNTEIHGGESVAKSSESLDAITNSISRRLESITREITDNIATSFHIRDVDQTSDKKRPLIHYQRFYNLLNMYDKELINQAKAYASRNYDISMNCAQSSLELTHHISDELMVLMKESQLKIQSTR